MDNEKILKDNLIIGHYKTMAIIESESGALYYIENADELTAPIGTVPDEELIQQITDLEQSEQKEIQFIFGGRG